MLSDEKVNSKMEPHLPSIMVLRRYWFLIVLAASIVAAFVKMEHDSSASLKEVETVRLEHGQVIHSLQDNQQHILEGQTKFQEQMFERIDRIHSQLDDVRNDITYLRAQHEASKPHH